MREAAPLLLGVSEFSHRDLVVAGMRPADALALLPRPASGE